MWRQEFFSKVKIEAEEYCYNGNFKKQVGYEIFIGRPSNSWDVASLKKSEDVTECYLLKNFNPLTNSLSQFPLTASYFLATVAAVTS
jgi:hypothetical protein